MVVLFVEPHPDDVALSAYSIVKSFLRKQFDVWLVSLFNSFDRSSKSWCKDVGVKYYDVIPDDDFLDTKSFISYTEYSQMTDPEQFQIKAYNFEKETFPVEKRLVKAIGEISPDFLVTVLGIRHKGHVATRCIVDKLGLPTAYFAELPYSVRKYGTYFVAKIASKYCVKFFSPFSDKVKLFSKNYPTERGILRYDRDVFASAEERLFFPNKGEEILESVRRAL